MCMYYIYISRMYIYVCIYIYIILIITIPYYSTIQKTQHASKVRATTCRWWRTCKFVRASAPPPCGDQNPPWCSHLSNWRRHWTIGRSWKYVDLSYISIYIYIYIDSCVCIYIYIHIFILSIYTHISLFMYIIIVYILYLYESSGRRGSDKKWMGSEKIG